MSLKDKYKQISDKFKQQKEAYEKKRKDWAENKALRLEQQAKKEDELMRVYQRQERARKKLQKSRDYKTRKVPQPQAKPLFDSGPLLPFESGKKKKKKAKKDSEFDFLPRI